MKNTIALAFVSFIIGSAAQAQVGAPEPVSPRPITPPTVSDAPPAGQDQSADLEKKSVEENKDQSKDVTPLSNLGDRVGTKHRGLDIRSLRKGSRGFRMTCGMRLQFD